MWPFSKPSIPSLIADRNARIAADLAARAKAHREEIAQRWPGHLNLLADGDSWFDYPLDGDLFGRSTDLIAALPGACEVRPAVYNLAHYGYTSTQELGYARQQMMAKALGDRTLGRFDAILISAGGNDIAGDALCIWLNDAKTVGGDVSQAIDTPRLSGAVGMVKAAYLDLIALRDDLLPGAPIFAHDYDYALPTGKAAHILNLYSMGPWLKPSLDYCGWTDLAQGAAIVRALMTSFSAMLDDLAAQPENNFIHVHTQGTLAADEWANELHATPTGFEKLAAKMAVALSARFPERV